MKKDFYHQIVHYLTIIGMIMLLGCLGNLAYIETTRELTRLDLAKGLIYLVVTLTFTLTCAILSTAEYKAQRKKDRPNHPIGNKCTAQVSYWGNSGWIICDFKKLKIAKAFALFLIINGHKDSVELKYKREIFIEDEKSPAITREVLYPIYDYSVILESQNEHM